MRSFSIPTAGFVHIAEQHDPGRIRCEGSACGGVMWEGFGYALWDWLGRPVKQSPPGDAFYAARPPPPHKLSW